MHVIGARLADDIQSRGVERRPRHPRPQPGTTTRARRPTTSTVRRDSASLGPPLPGTGGSLLALVARATSLTDLLPQLHRHALCVVDGQCSLLFERNASTGTLLATSACGLDTWSTDSWTPVGADAAFLSDAVSRATPTMIVEGGSNTPELLGRLGTRGAWLLPLLQRDKPVGLLAIGLAGQRSASTPDLAEVADAFTTALELFRLRQSDSLQRSLRTVLDEFAGILGVTLNLSAGLDAFCHGACRLFGARRTAVWVHDRRARHLLLRGSSDGLPLAANTRVAADDHQSLAAATMRQADAEIHFVDDPADLAVVTVPLRGCRRALGTLVFEGVKIEPGREMTILDRANELGRQLSSAIENMQLLDDVVRSRRELENTFDSIAHLVVVWDRRDRIVHANHAFASRVGLTHDALLERPLYDFVGSELAGWLSEQASGDPSDGEPPASFEVVDPVLNGPFMVTVTALRNHEGERVGSVLVARDLTAQTKMYEEREELRRRLLQSEKLAALGQFVAGIAHELNNPLQGVLGHLELLRVTGAFPKKLRREIQTIYREADRAAKIVRNLLAFSGSRRLSRRAVSVNAVLQKVVLVRAAACRAAGIEVVRHYDEKLPRVQSDPLLLHQVFLNLLMNAEHAISETRRGGRIEITTAAAEGDRVIVSVRDTGSGIPADVASRIFEPFYTTKEVGKGSGLGLAITYGIVQEHGGEIVASNHPEGGAVFTIQLPARVAVPREETDGALAVGVQ